MAGLPLTLIASCSCGSALPHAAVQRRQRPAISALAANQYGMGSSYGSRLYGRPAGLLVVPSAFSSLALASFPPSRHQQPSRLQGLTQRLGGGCTLHERGGHARESLVCRGLFRRGRKKKEVQVQQPQEEGQEDEKLQESAKPQEEKQVWRPVTEVGKDGSRR